MLRDEFLRFNDIDIKEITIPVYNIKMYIKSWTGKFRHVYETKLRDEKYTTLRELICMLSLCDEKGELLFDYLSQKDLEALLQKDSSVLEYIATEATNQNVRIRDAEKK